MACRCWCLAQQHRRHPNLLCSRCGARRDSRAPAKSASCVACDRHSDVGKMYIVVWRWRPSAQNIILSLFLLLLRPIPLWRPAPASFSAVARSCLAQMSKMAGIVCRRCRCRLGFHSIWILDSVLVSRSAVSSESPIPLASCSVSASKNWFGCARYEKEVWPAAAESDFFVGRRKFQPTYSPGPKKKNRKAPVI